MAYRDAIESVLERCMQLRARIQRFEHVRSAVRACETLAEALAWESELQKRLRALEELAAESEPIAPAVAQALPSGRTHSALLTTIWFTLLLAAVVVAVAELKR